MTPRPPGCPSPPAAFVDACWSFLGPGYATGITMVDDVRDGRIHRIEEGSGTSPLAASRAYRSAEVADAAGLARVVEDGFGKGA